MEVPAAAQASTRVLTSTEKWSSGPGRCCDTRLSCPTPATLPVTTGKTSGAGASGAGTSVGETRVGETRVGEWLPGGAEGAPGAEGAWPWDAVDARTRWGTNMQPSRDAAGATMGTCRRPAYRAQGGATNNNNNRCAQEHMRPGHIPPRHIPPRTRSPSLLACVCVHVCGQPRKTNGTGLSMQVMGGGSEADLGHK
jgi:hypothetical protein